MVVSLLVILPTGGHSMSIHCRIDQDCSSGEYCYDSARCVDCLDCKAYNRQAKANGLCAKTKNQCGPCFFGMDAAINTDGSLSTCKQILTDIESTNTNFDEKNINSDNQNSKSWIVYVYAILGSLLLLILVFLAVITYTKRDCLMANIFVRFCPNRIMNNINNCPAEPPPYSEKSPTAPPFEEPGGLPPDPPVRQVYRPVEYEPSQRANPFHNPNYVRGGTLGSNSDPEPAAEDDDESENDALINPTSISHPEDEETQPSVWTPTESINSNPVAQLTTFSNALSLQQLSISQPQPICRTTQNSSPASEDNDNSEGANSSENQNFSSGSARGSGLPGQHINIVNQININIPNLQ